MHVWSIPEARHSIDAVRDMLISTPTGQRVRLADVADVSIRPTPNLISREASRRRINVEANVKGRDLAAVAGDVQSRLQKIAFPLGYHAVLQGEYAELRAARARLQLFALLALVGIFILLRQSFDSWRLAVLSFVTLPSALVGGVLGGMARGRCRFLLDR